MENASKALIIAGAILLAILIIGLGVFIYNQASNTVSETGMDQVAVRQFNAQFEPYIKNNVSGVTAMALYDTVSTHNATAEDNKKVTLILERRSMSKSLKFESVDLKKMAYSNITDDIKVVRLMDAVVNPGYIRFQKSELVSTKKYDIFVDEYDNGVIKTIFISEL